MEKMLEAARNFLKDENEENGNVFIKSLLDHVETQQINVILILKVVLLLSKTNTNAKNIIIKCKDMKKLAEALRESPAHYTGDEFDKFLEEHKETTAKIREALE